MSLFHKAHGLLKEGMGFIREHDFGNSYDESYIKCFIRFVDEWKGPHHNFVDRKMQMAWSDVATTTKAFTYLMIEKCGSLPGTDRIMTVKTISDFQQGERSPQTVKAAEELNSAADASIATWDKFLALAARRLEVSLTSDAKVA